jgi:hypothetical protein
MDMQIVGAPSLSADEIYLIASALAGNPQPQYNIYFSRVRFTTTVSTTPFQYTVTAAQKNIAFGYGQGQSATVGGLEANATTADTSMQNAGQTINSEFCLIRGVSCFIAGGSDLVLAKQLDARTTVTLVLGPTSYQLGTPTMNPGWGGFMGTTESNIVNPNLYEQFSKAIGGFSNGLPVAGNTQKLPRSLLWMPPGKGTASNMNVILYNTVTATLPSNMLSADRTVGTAGSTYNGAPSAWTHQGASTVSAAPFVDFIVALDHVPFYLG